MATGCELGQVRKEAAAATTLGVWARLTGSATSIYLYKNLYKAV